MSLTKVKSQVIDTLSPALGVTSGGTGLASLTSNSVVLGNGTNAVQLVAPGSSGNVLTSNGTTWTSSPLGVIGVGQTWQNVTANRAFGTEYTNNTGKPIMVYCHAGGTGRSDIIVGGVTIGQFQANANYVNGNGSFIVPAGNTYRINSSAVLSNWSELR